jgi:hypothetical protein
VNRLAAPHHRTIPSINAAMPIALERFVRVLVLLCSNVFMTFACRPDLHNDATPFVGAASAAKPATCP